VVCVAAGNWQQRRMHAKEELRAQYEAARAEPPVGLAAVPRNADWSSLRYREVVVMCDLQELSYADAADALGCAVGTVRSRLHRGRQLLAAKLSAREAVVSNPEAPVTSVNASEPLGPVKLRRSRSWA